MANGTDPAGQSQPGFVTPEEIQHQEFGVSRFGGYRMRDVDEFLDRLTASTQALIAENDRLRSGDGGPILGTPDLDEVNRQADEILQRARAEAARVVAEASAAGGGATAGGDRGAVDPFLTQERDFLQNLAALVQNHAESVKAMARAARQAAEAPATMPQGETGSVVDVSDAAAGQAQAKARPDEPAEDVAPEPGSNPEPESKERTQSPAQTREAPARPEGGGGEGDPSLRALFWGDD